MIQRSKFSIQKSCVLSVANSTNFCNANNNGNANYNNASNVNRAVPIRTQDTEVSSGLQSFLGDKENATCHFKNDELGSQRALDTSIVGTAGSTFFDNKLEEITSMKVLNDSFYQNQKASDWKFPTQSYENNLLRENFQLQEEVRNLTYKEGPKNHFGLDERGKHREIDSPIMRDRVIGKSLNQNVLLPHIRPQLIYDNYASLKKRGPAFGRNRLELFLREAVQKFGPTFACGRIDIKGYFPHIDRRILYKQLTDLVPYPSVYPLMRVTIGSLNELGLNLGSECPQSYAIYYLNCVDQYCKVVKGLRFYGRYMDDIFIFMKTKEELREFFKELETYIQNRLNLNFNKKKSGIVTSHQGFTFMQVDYWVTKEGKVKSSPCNERFRRERRKLHHYRSLWDKDKCKMTLQDIYNSYQSWRGETLQLKNCQRRIEKLDKLYNELFGGLKERPLVVDREEKCYEMFGGC